MKKQFIINTLAICACLFLTSSRAFAWETTSDGVTHIETLIESGKKVLWIQGDTAQDLYQTLKFKDGYRETVDKKQNMVLLTNKNKPNDWLCINIVGELSDLQVKAEMTKYNCRQIVAIGTEQ